jgi:hypothetical protein
MRLNEFWNIHEGTRMKKIFILLLISILATFLRAQSTDHLKMNLLFSGAHLSVEMEYLVRAEGTSDSLFFILNPMHHLDTIMAPGLREYRMGQRPDRPFPGQVLYFERDLEPGEEIPVSFEYDMNLSASNHWDSGWIELNIDKLWFPIRGDLDNEITYEVSIEGFPEGFDLVSHMDASLVRQGDQIHITQPHTVQEVLILAGEGMRHRKLSKNIGFFAGRQVSDSVLWSMHGKVDQSIDFLNETVGQAAPIDDFRVVLRNTGRSELGFQFNRKNMIVTGPDFDDYADLSHEIAHFWWTGADFIEEPWMNESFANYLMFMVLERFDPENYRKVLESYRRRAEGVPPVAEATLFANNAFRSYYHKGSILLKELEDQIGKERMQGLLSTCIQENIHSTSGFIRVLRKEEGAEVADRFQESLKE